MKIESLFDNLIYDVFQTEQVQNRKKSYKLAISAKSIEVTTKIFEYVVDNIALVLPTLQYSCTCFRSWMKRRHFENILIHEKKKSYSVSSCVAQLILCMCKQETLYVSYVWVKTRMRACLREKSYQIFHKTRFCVKKKRT